MIGKRGNDIVMYGCVSVTKSAGRTVAALLIAQISFLVRLKDLLCFAVSRDLDVFI